MKIFSNVNIQLSEVGKLLVIGSQLKDNIILHSNIDREVDEDLVNGVDGLSLSYLNDSDKVIIKIDEKTDSEIYPNEKIIGLFFNEEYGFDTYQSVDNGEIILNKVFKDYIPTKTAQVVIIELKDDSGNIGVVTKTNKNLTDGVSYMLTSDGWEEVDNWILENDSFTTILDNPA